MDSIRRQHFAVVYASIILCASAYYFAIKQYPDFATFAQSLGNFAVSWTIVPALLIGAYELVGWRLTNAELDFAGYWDGEEEQYRYEPEGAKLDYTAWCEMRVRQDVRRICIVEGRTHPGKRADAKGPQSMWFSTACELDAQTGRIVAMLGADTTPIRVGGPIESATELFNVTKRGLLGRPIKMQSVVKMSAGTANPRFVIISYTRRKWWTRSGA